MKIKEMIEDISFMIEDMSIMGAIALLTFGDFIFFLLGGFTLVDCLFRLSHGVIDNFSMGVDVILIALSVAAIVVNTIFSVTIIIHKLVELAKNIREEIAKSRG